MGFPKTLALVLAITILVCLSIPNPSLADDSPSDYLDPHNKARKHAGVDPLYWKKELAQYAEQSAGNCGGGSYNDHYGVNVYKGRHATPYDAVKEWTKCEHGDCGADYKQVVWPHTKWLGCARHRCHDHDGEYYYIVCYYDPPASKH